MQIGGRYHTYRVAVLIPVEENKGKRSTKACCLSVCLSVCLSRNMRTRGNNGKKQKCFLQHCILLTVLCSWLVAGEGGYAGCLCKYRFFWTCKQKCRDIISIPLCKLKLLKECWIIFNKIDKVDVEGHWFWFGNLQPTNLLESLTKIEWRPLIFLVYYCMKQTTEQVLKSNKHFG